VAAFWLEVVDPGPPAYPLRVTFLEYRPPWKQKDDVEVAQPDLRQRRAQNKKEKSAFPLAFVPLLFFSFIIYSYETLTPLLRISVGSRINNWHFIRNDLLLGA
jgi:hypothetical protein